MLRREMAVVSEPATLFRFVSLTLCVLIFVLWVIGLRSGMK